MKSLKTAFVCLCAVMILAAQPTMAAKKIVIPEAASTEAARPVEAAEANQVESSEEAGLPQLNTKLFPEQLFWLAVSFGLLYLMMHFVGLPAVKDTQDKRSQTIGGDLEAAQKANEQAKTMMAEYEKALADARAKAQATVSEIAAQAAKASAEKQAEQQKQLGKRLAEAEAKIAATRDAAVKDVKGSAADLAAVIVEKVTAKSGARHVA